MALYVVAAGHAGRKAPIALAMSLGTLAGYLAVRLVMDWNVGTSSELAVALTSVVTWLLGRAARQSREHAEEARTQAAEQAAIGERLRIARELHDLVAHSIGIIALRAGAARRVLDTQPEAAREALAAVVR